MVIDYSSNYSQDQNILWDFRQFYIEWTRKYIEAFQYFHLKNNYPGMIEALSKWHDVLWGRCIKEFNENNSEDKTFENLLKKFTELSNNEKYRMTYLGKEKNSEAVANLNKAVGKMVIYNVWLMKKNKFFGSDTINRGLT